MSECVCAMYVMVVCVLYVMCECITMEHVVVYMCDE